MLGQWYYELFDLQSHCQDFLFPSRASCIWQLQLCRFKPFYDVPTVPVHYHLFSSIPLLSLGQETNPNVVVQWRSTGLRSKLNLKNISVTCWWSCFQPFTSCEPRWVCDAVNAFVLCDRGWKGRLAHAIVIIELNYFSVVPQMCLSRSVWGVEHLLTIELNSILTKHRFPLDPQFQAPSLRLSSNLVTRGQGLDFTLCSH